MPTYTAYGLVIEADFPIPELVPAGGSPDVVIRLGDVPDQLDESTERGAVYQSDATRFLLNIDGVARYLVTSGREICVQRGRDVPWSDVRVFLLGSCFGALLHQRGFLTLHASAILTPAGGVMFCGRSGAGKSTLLGAFLQRGYAMLADDAAALSVNAAGDVTIAPGFPRTRLWEDAARKLGKDPTRLVRLRAALHKYDVAVDGHFPVQPVAAHRIYVLSPHADDRVTLVPAGPAERFGLIVRHTYRRGYLDGLGLRAPHFNQASAVANRVAIDLVQRPSGSYRLEELADAIEGDLRHHADVPASKR